MQENNVATSLVMKTLAEKRGTDSPARVEAEEEEPIMIDEDYSIRDDGTNIIDISLRHRLTTPNVDPATYWTKVPFTRVSKPRKGNNLYKVLPPHHDVCVIIYSF